MTGGMAFEAMNHAGVSNSNLLIVLNDNCMSIDPNVGALKDYLTDITTSQTYNKFRDEVWTVLGKISKFGPNAQDIVSKIENGIKSAFLKQSNLFESLNFRYFGPIDGHDVVHLSKVLNDLKDTLEVLRAFAGTVLGHLSSQTGHLSWLRRPRRRCSQSPAASC